MKVKETGFRHSIVFIMIVSFVLPFFLYTGSMAEEAGGSQALESYLSDTKTLLKNFEYIIGPEDELEVFVWRNPDLSKTVTVAPDGSIALPVIDEITASGLTVKELDKAITEKYCKIIKNPQVSVFIRGFRSKRVTVLGEVMHPGVYPITGRLSVLEIISMATYDKNRADLKSVMIVREEGGKPAAKRCNLVKAIRGKELNQNVQLQSGDIIFVPSSFIAEVNVFVDLFFGKTKPVLDFYLAGYKALRSPDSSQ